MLSHEATPAKMLSTVSAPYGSRGEASVVNTVETAAMFSARRSFSRTVMNGVRPQGGLTRRKNMSSSSSTSRNTMYATASWDSGGFRSHTALTDISWSSFLRSMPMKLCRALSRGVLDIVSNVLVALPLEEWTPRVSSHNRQSSTLIPLANDIPAAGSSGLSTSPWSRESSENALKCVAVGGS